MPPCISVVNSTRHWQVAAQHQERVTARILPQTLGDCLMTGLLFWLLALEIFVERLREKILIGLGIALNGLIDQLL